MCTNMWVTEKLKMLDAQKLVLKAVMIHLIQMLGAEVRSLGRAMHARRSLRQLPLEKLLG